MGAVLEPKVHNTVLFFVVVVLPVLKGKCNATDISQNHTCQLPIAINLSFILEKKKVEEEETGLRAKRGALGLDLVQHCQWDFSFPKVKGRGVLCALCSGPALG